MRKMIVLATMLLGFVMFGQTPEPLRVDLTKGDVAHVLIDANKAYGFELISVYENKQGKLVFVFRKGDEFKTFVSSK
jgi:hypothetical protein